MNTRQTFLFALTTFATVLLLGRTPALAQPETDKPNILFVFADDMSYETIGAADVLDIDTPNLDRLARRGASFTHAYNMGAWGGAVCTASRSMLNTGRFLWQAQASVNPSIEKKHMWSQRMQTAGYQTYMTGKWHVPKTEPDGLFDVVKNVRDGMPKDFRGKGSEDGTKPRFYGYNRPLDEDDYENGWKPWDKTNGGFWEGGTHWSEVVANDGIEYLETAAKDDKPFFMYLAFNATHDPRQSPKEYIDRYPLERVELPKNFLPQYPHTDEICGLGLRDEKLMPYPRTEFAVKVHRQEYFAIITHMDDQIGRIMEALENSGKADNTYIVFTADHGLAVGRHGLSGKQNMYDHSVRVPFFVVGPNIEPGVELDTPIYLQDAMATVLDLAGASKQGVDFKSLLPLLRGQTTEHYAAIYGAYMNKQRMVTVGDWKLISYPTIGVERLYKVKEDLHEMQDLADDPAYAQQLSQMREALNDVKIELEGPRERTKR
jgi:choline-sulfatase